MPREPYNLFSDAGSTLPGGSAYDDLLVILKAVIQDCGGRLDIPEDLVMYIDREETLRVDDAFFDGKNHKIFTIERTLANQNPEGQVRHEVEDETKVVEWSVRVGRGCGTIIAFITLFAFAFLVFQVFRAVFA